MSSYRGQNAKMHSCEALIAAFEATGETHAICIGRKTPCAQHHRAPSGTGNWLDLGTLSCRLEHGLGLQLPRQQQHVPAVEISARPHDRVGQTAAGASRYIPTERCRLASVARLYAVRSHHTQAAWHRPVASVTTKKYFWVQTESFETSALLAKRTGEQRYWYSYQRGYGNTATAHLSDQETRRLVAYSAPGQPPLQIRKTNARQDRLLPPAVRSPLPAMAYENKPPQLQKIKALPEKWDLIKRCRTEEADIEKCIKIICRKNTDT